MNMYNIGVSVYCPAGINTEGFQEENKTKPKETVEIEGSSSTLTPDQCADILIAGLKRVKREGVRVYLNVGRILYSVRVLTFGFVEINYNTYFYSSFKCSY